jgi:hypothetical protein
MPAVAVVGDPNTGKSVFSYLLFKEFIRRGAKVFRQEGDPSAPTSPWYLESGAEELRRKVKTPWDWRKVTWVRDSIQALKKTFDWVIVDAPGGRPPEERVTKELAEILKPVDSAIILCRSDNYGECVSSWTRELKQKAPHVRILFTCTSTLEDSVSTFDPASGRCILVGLDRGQAREPREDLRKAISSIADYLQGTF